MSDVVSKTCTSMQKYQPSLFFSINYFKAAVAAVLPRDLLAIIENSVQTVT